MISLPDLKNADVKGKKVFLRLDLDVPLSKQSTINNQSPQMRDPAAAGQLTIADDTRLRDSLETLKYILDDGATVIIAGHLGRPQNKFKIQNSEFRVQNIGGFDGWRISDKLFLLENLRFNSGEESNDLLFSKKLASLADIYVNDAFASSHRVHASIVGVAKLLPHFAGFMLKKEVETLSSLLENPKRPLAVIIGGAKIETKLPLVEKMHQIADYVLVGGLIAEETKVLLEVQHEKVSPPAGGRKSALLVADLNGNKTDITSKDAENFLQIISLAKTIVWNGSVGKTEGNEGNLEIGSAK